MMTPGSIGSVSRRTNKKKSSSLHSSQEAWRSAEKDRGSRDCTDCQKESCCIRSSVRETGEERRAEKRKDDEQEKERGEKKEKQEENKGKGLKGSGSQGLEVKVTVNLEVKDKVEVKFTGGGRGKGHIVPNIGPFKSTSERAG